MTTPAAAAAQRRVAVNKDWLGPALTCLGVVLLALVPMVTSRGDVINLLFLLVLLLRPQGLFGRKLR